MDPKLVCPAFSSSPAPLFLQNEIQVPNLGIQVNCNWPQPAFPSLIYCQLPCCLGLACSGRHLYLSTFSCYFEAHFHENFPNYACWIPRIPNLLFPRSQDFCCIIFLCSEQAHVACRPPEMWDVSYPWSCSLHSQVCACLRQPGELLKLAILP